MKIVHQCLLVLTTPTELGVYSPQVQNGTHRTSGKSPLAGDAATHDSSCLPVEARSTTTTHGGFEYTYPYPIRFHELQTQHQTLCQAYMDVPPKHTSGEDKTIMLLHGKNFCGVTWTDTIEVLRAQVYRVIVPDQIGFCKSDKPEAY